VNPATPAQPESQQAAQDPTNSDGYIEYVPESSPSEFYDDSNGSFAEVETDTVSDASWDDAEQFEYEQQDQFFNPEPLASGDGFQEIPVSSFDQMKAVVTGEQTQVQPVSNEVADASFEAQDESFSDDDTSESDSFVSVADGFTGQLIIPLPGGGALRLDWPLGFDYVVNNDTPQATFTEVPTDGDEFADFNE